MESTVTSRLSRSISMPLRARSTSFLPSRLSAEYIGGVWRMRPTNRAAACRTASAPGRGPSQRAVTAPVLSCVSVRTPSRIDAR